MAVSGTLQLDGLTLVLTVRGKEFVLTCPTQDLGMPDPPNPSNMTWKVKFAFHEPFERAVNVGTPAELFAELQTALGAVLPGGAPALDVQWTAFKTQLVQAPILNQVSETVLNTEVYITDLVLDLTFVRTTPSGGAATSTFDGSFELGLMFKLPTTPPAQVFGFQLRAFGGKIKLEVAGDSSQLGFDWP